MRTKRSTGDESTESAGDVDSSGALAPTPLPSPSARGRPPLLAFWVRWRERRFAVRCCDELLRLYETAAASHPGLSGRELYRLVVTTHCGGDIATVQSVLQRAEESYALWPVSRELTFRDVVHYLAVSGYWDEHEGERWILSDLKPVIDAAIPSRF